MVVQVLGVIVFNTFALILGHWEDLMRATPRWDVYIMLGSAMNSCAVTLVRHQTPRLWHRRLNSM
jgi:hypothetical protein